MPPPLVRPSSSAPPRPSFARHALLFLAFAAPVLAFTAILIHTFVGLPLLDDYDACLGFLLRQQAAHGPSPKLLAAIVDQQFQYKFILMHLVMLAQRALAGRFSFVPLTILGDLLFAPILGSLLANSFPHVPVYKRLLLLLPAVYCICQLTFAEVFNFSVGSWNGLAVVCFVTLSLHFLVRAARPAPPRALFMGACLSLIAACGSSTNAFLFAPIGAVLLVKARKYTAAVLWCAVTVFCLALYLFRRHPVSQPVGPPLTQLLFVFSFAGGAVENMHRKPVPGAAILLGIVLFLVIGDAIRTRFAQRNPYFAALTTWVVVTALVVARYRSVFGLTQSLSSRYKLYSMLLIVAAYVYLAQRVLDSKRLSPRIRTRAFAGALTVSVLFCVAGDVAGLQLLTRRKQWVTAGMRQFVEDPDHNSPIANASPEFFAETELERTILYRAVMQGIWRPPSSK